MVFIGKLVERHVVCTITRYNIAKYFIQWCDHIVTNVSIVFFFDNLFLSICAKFQIQSYLNKKKLSTRILMNFWKFPNPVGISESWFESYCRTLEHLICCCDVLLFGHIWFHLHKFAIYSSFKAQQAFLLQSQYCTNNISDFCLLSCSWKFSYN